MSSAVTFHAIFHHIRLVALCAMLLACGAQAFGKGRVAGRLLVRVNAGLSEDGVRTALASLGVREIDSIPGLGVRVLEVPEIALEIVAAALQHNPNIAFVEVEHIAAGGAVANDPYVVNGAQWHLPRVQALKAWDTTTGNPNVKVAIVDSGLQLNHPEFANRILPGYDFINNDSDPTDDHGHGTAVAGVCLAAGNNGSGVAGVAYRASILPVKVLDSACYGPYSTIAKGIVFAADQGARIINVSVYGSGVSQTLQSAVDYAWSKNAVVIACAGNEGNTTLQYPAACRHAIAVTNLTTSDSRSATSSYGAHVAISAPGTGIWTTQRTSSYGSWSGTSFASPIVAGVGALMLSVNPSLSNTEIIDGLARTADDLGPAGRDPEFGYGRVNAVKAVTAAVNTPSDTTSPTVSIASPSSGSSVSGIVNVVINSADDTVVRKVELFIDGILAGTSTNPTPTFTWDTTVTEDGPCTLRAVVYDDAGNTGTTSDVITTITNGTHPDTVAPTTRIVSPKGGSVLNSKTKVKVSAADDQSIVRVELYLDDHFVASSDTAVTVFTVRPGKLRAGTHRLKAIGYDAAGNVGVSKVVKVIKP